MLWCLLLRNAEPPQLGQRALGRLLRVSDGIHKTEFSERLAPRQFKLMLVETSEMLVETSDFFPQYSSVLQA